VAGRLNQQPEPFVSSIFTLSPHHPFTMPKGFESTFPKGRHPIQGLVAYTDHALKCFFEKISSMPWYPHTLFVLVADHTAGSVEPYYQGPIGAFSIPIIFFDPEHHLPQKYSEKLAQQIDILPTILHLMGYSEPYVAFGQNLMNEHREHFMINLKADIHQLISDDYCLQFDGETTIGFFDRKNDSLAQKNLLADPAYDFSKKKYEKFLQAFLQQYSQALAQDVLTAENWLKIKNSKVSRFTI
jgi:arylsulfatase A-like enzyme